MALFFDKDWFDAALARAGLRRGDLALALGLGEEEIAEVWKDQRELSARDVATIAVLLAVPAAEIADRAGVSTPVPRPLTPAERTLDRISERLDRIEGKLDALKALLLDLRRAP